MKKYLVCSYDEPDDGNDAPETGLTRETFQDFSDAVAQYLFRCATRDDVIFADLETRTIVRQYAHASGDEAGDAFCIR